MSFLTVMSIKINLHKSYNDNIMVAADIKSGTHEKRIMLV